MSPQDDHEHEHARMSDEGCPNHPPDHAMRCAMCGHVYLESQAVPHPGCRNGGCPDCAARFAAGMAELEAMNGAPKIGDPVYMKIPSWDAIELLQRLAEAQSRRHEAEARRIVSLPGDERLETILWEIAKIQIRGVLAAEPHRLINLAKEREIEVAAKMNMLRDPIFRTVAETTASFVEALLEAKAHA